MQDYFKNKKYNKEKLLKFGFKKEGQNYTYRQFLFEGQFEFEIKINSKNIKTKLTEIQTKEPYTLHLIEGVEGEFIGKIKEEFNNVLEKISLNCFEKDIFKNKQTLELIKYIKDKYNDKLEYLWEKSPKNAIVRRKDNLKWYCVFMTVSKEKFNYKNSDFVEVLNLRVNNLEKITDNKTIFPAYHMNKKYWISVILDESVSSEIIEKLIDESYNLIKDKK